jgi:oleandomycin transport system permease protein
MDACRALLNGAPPGDSVPTTLLWCAALLAVFCPLAVRAYGRQQ